MKPSSILLSLDPGVQTGYALWASFPENRPPVLRAHGVIAPQQGAWHDKVSMVMQLLHQHIQLAKLEYQVQPLSLACEWPFYADTGGAQVSASSGALVKLAVSVGCIKQFAFDRGLPCRFVEVREWKGQMPKSAVISRITRKLGAAACKDIKTHAWDAVGIGMHVLGMF